MKQMNEYNKRKTDVDTENKLVVTDGAEGHERGRKLRGTNYYV